MIFNFANSWKDEYSKDTRYGLKGKKIFEEKSEFQKITIFESKRYGKALLLDDCWMTAEKQEKQYHECIVHPALSSSKSIDNVLIIGGGDGGTARECLKYKDIKNLDLVEIDYRVVEISKNYLSNIGSGCWKDLRMNVMIADGISWVNEARTDFYDVIIVDSSDPKGPAKGLFNKTFYQNCLRIIKSDGVFAAQTESPEEFEEIHINIVKTIKEVFKYANTLYGNVPLYPSGVWSWTFASINEPRYLKPILRRCNNISKTCDVWSPRWQKGSFEAIPANLERKLRE